MCGIVGYIGNKNRASEILLGGLKKLEYRGYDSAGISLQVKKKIKTFKVVGKVNLLENKIKKHNLISHLGIAHTRWATHGKPSIKNAHPHQSGKIFLVHNGIIENYQILKNKLQKKGHKFYSDTDSEVVAHLISDENKKYDFNKAVLRALKQLRGAYALLIINQEEPDKMIAVRNSSPLVLGIAKSGFILASDTSAIIEYTKKVIYPDDGEIISLSPDSYQIKNFKGQNKRKKTHILDWNESEARKEGYKHFMLKEIHEQPEAISDAIRGRIILNEGEARLGGLFAIKNELRKINRIIIISCGTSYNSGLVGEYMLEEYAGIPTEVEYASEFRYRKPLINKNTAVLAISQSGETADTLAAIKEAKNKGALTLGIVNVVSSSIARETDAGIYNHAGPEIGVASTKAFTSQLAILSLLTVFLGRQRDMSLTTGKKILSELEKIPGKVEKILKQSEKIRKLANKYAKFTNMFYLGRKYNYPIALEGALKIKEISYIHAEGYPSGEMKHGPIALIDKNFPSVVVAPHDSVLEKNISAIEEIRARNGQVLAIINSKDKSKIEKYTKDFIEIPTSSEILTPLLSVIPLQLLAYYAGVKKGYDVDKPRNLAKSVTVE